ncbi:MAG: hypothetical protein PF568_00470 [Deltaproteobacteria bacterium]|jgi:hypothetical protein|nr:hypothetical protein [Deltaproteobacteria bacterium]
MEFIDWFALGMKKNKEIQVKKIKKESVHLERMAAGSLTSAADILARMVDQRNAQPKLRMVQDGEYAAQVTDYAMKMAQRLDCEIIALDVTDKPLQFDGDRRTREIDRFMGMARTNVEKFICKAKACGIKVEHVMEVRDPQEAIAQLSAADAGIRFVLTRPEGAAVRVLDDRLESPSVLKPNNKRKGDFLVRTGWRQK